MDTVRQVLVLGGWGCMHDRDAYTMAKGDFIGKYTAKAKDEYGDRWSNTGIDENKETT